jgi:hypothetical protein
MKIAKIREFLLNGLVLLVSAWTVLALSFQLTIIGFHFTNNEKGIKTIQDWFNSNIDGHFKKS